MEIVVQLASTTSHGWISKDARAACRQDIRVFGALASLRTPGFSNLGLDHPNRERHFVDAELTSLKSVGEGRGSHCFSYRQFYSYICGVRGLLERAIGHTERIWDNNYSESKTDVEMMWNHAECILKQRGQFHTVDDVEGVDALRYEDQEKIRKYLNDLTGGFATNIYASPTIDGLDESSIEKSKSSRATCKSCNQKIIKGQVRISTTSDPDNPWVRGTLPVWRHAKCFLEMGWWTNAMEKMSGWDSLTSEDKQAVQSIAKPYIRDAKLEPKQNAGQPLERPCQSSNISEGRKIIDEASVEGKGEKRKPEVSETLPVKNENTGASPNNRTRKLDGHVGEGSVPKAAKLEKQVEDQTKLGGNLVPINILGVLKTLVADYFGGLPMQTEVPEDLEEMRHIPFALLGTVKQLKRAKTQLDYLQAENDELKATQELAREKLKKEFASVPLLPTHERELEFFSEEQRRLMEVTYKACQYKQMLAQQCTKKESQVPMTHSNEDQDLI